MHSSWYITDELYSLHDMQAVQQLSLSNGSSQSWSRMQTGFMHQGTVCPNNHMINSENYQAVTKKHEERSKNLQSTLLSLIVHGHWLHELTEFIQLVIRFMDQLQVALGLTTIKLGTVKQLSSQAILPQLIMVWYVAQVFPAKSMMGLLYTSPHVCTVKQFWSKHGY